MCIKNKWEKDNLMYYYHLEILHKTILRDHFK
jgi:hypothetical protein